MREGKEEGDENEANHLISPDAVKSKNPYMIKKNLLTAFSYIETEFFSALFDGRPKSRPASTWWALAP